MMEREECSGRGERGVEDREEDRYPEESWSKGKYDM